MEEDLLNFATAFTAARGDVGQENASDPLSRLCRTEVPLARAVVLQAVRDLLYKNAGSGVRLDAEVFILSGAIKPWLEGTGDGNVANRYDKLVDLAKTSREERLAQRQARKTKRLQRVAA